MLDFILHQNANNIKDIYNLPVQAFSSTSSIQSFKTSYAISATLSNWIFYIMVV